MPQVFKRKLKSRDGETIVILLGGGSKRRQAADKHSSRWVLNG